MAKVFLDANYFVDILEKRKLLNLKQFSSHELYLSPLSIHIYTYLYKIKIPDSKLQNTLDNFNVINVGESEAESSLQGPTSDFEDNLQLHCAAEADCDYFLTNDKRLLSIRYFGKTRIADHIHS